MSHTKKKPQPSIQWMSQYLQAFILGIICNFLFSCQFTEPKKVLKQRTKHVKACLQSESPLQVCPTMGHFASFQQKTVSEKGLVNKVNLYQSTTSQTRAEIKGEEQNSLGLCFQLKKGPETKSSLASGLQREQIGLKLKAQDSCNVLYVMWRLRPKNQIVISQKINPGQQKHGQCKNGGYKNLKVIPVETFPEQDIHQLLQVHLQGVFLEVYLNQKKLWGGDLPSETKSLRGPLGIRSDNVHFTFFLEKFDPKRTSCPIGKVAI